MKKISLPLIFIILGSIFASPFSSWASDASTSGRILDNFKKQEQEILFETSPIEDSGANILLEHEYALNGITALKDRISSIQTVLSDKKSDATEQRLTLEWAIANLDTAISLTQESITRTESGIYEKNAKIQELQRASFELKKKIAEHKKIILSYLANIYSEGNLILDHNGGLDVMKWLILSDTSTDSILSDMMYKSLVSQLGQSFVNEYRSFIKEYYTLTLDLDDQVGQLDVLKKDLSTKMTAIVVQKNEREKLLEVTKGQELLYQKYIDAQEEAKQWLELAWQQTDQKYQSALQDLLVKSGCGNIKKTPESIRECSRIYQYFANEKELQGTTFATGTENILTWPVTSTRISTSFRDVWYSSTYGSQHDAIDIPIAQWTDVKAAFDGYVYYILPPTPGWYSYMVLKHRDGFITVYGHLSEITAPLYQFVQAGDIIAKSGGAPGTPGAGPMTSGAHLHFEVWKNRESVDPLRYLSLSSLNYGDLTSRYQEKFITDIIEKSGSGTDTSAYQLKFSIRGTTEKDRQIDLLKKYASPDFKSWDLWVDASLTEKIDPSFLMCVGLAETTLGNHLKTAYNVGNIGNTDDGGTYDFSSPLEGIEWMAQTLNNKYLSKYTKVSELSRWGNEDGAIYASSNGNWHNNVIRCLSALKWRFVEDGYKFRVKS